MAALRDLEARGRARATVTRRLCTIGGFYKYAVDEELLEHAVRGRSGRCYRGENYRGIMES
jgi:site-specific recombinase XerD